MICTRCNKKFLYSDIIKAAWGVNRTIECSNCNKIYKLTVISSTIISVLVAFPLLFLSILMDTLGYYVLYAYLPYVTVMILLSPFWVRFKPLKAN